MLTIAIAHSTPVASMLLWSIFGFVSGIPVGMLLVERKTGKRADIQ